MTLGSAGLPTREASSLTRADFVIYLLIFFNRYCVVIKLIILIIRSEKHFNKNPTDTYFTDRYHTDCGNNKQNLSINNVSAITPKKHKNLPIVFRSFD
ncbi:hypothetical protein, partial [Enterobacter cloacae complex sp. 2DZ2F20B]|uniref:hypothetical protein n=1 Tax=Enterobacter cloacae complex sp. 2DZ2F20B TaxID=2511993 RepID=UPI001CA535E8